MGMELIFRYQPADEEYEAETTSSDYLVDLLKASVRLADEFESLPSFVNQYGAENVQDDVEASALDISFDTDEWDAEEMQWGAKRAVRTARGEKLGVAMDRIHRTRGR